MEFTEIDRKGSPVFCGVNRSVAEMEEQGIPKTLCQIPSAMPKHHGLADKIRIP